MLEIDPDRFARAVAFATRVHAGQTRKGGASNSPYLCHLLQVSGIILEHGGSEDQAIAGLLHDTVEDSVEVTSELLEAEFGAAVAEIVVDCTDTLPGDTPHAKAPWKERKQRYLEHLTGVADTSLLVAACDKANNLASMVSELRARGLGLLSQFKGSPEEQVWYYREFMRRIAGRLPLRLEVELESLNTELRMLIHAGDTKRFSQEELRGP